LTPTREWPSVSEIKEFRDKVRALVIDVIDNKMKLEDGDEINFSHPFWIITMGIEHEKIHLETTSCLIRQLPLRVIKQNPKSVFYQRELKNGRNLDEALKISNNFKEVPEQHIKIGRSHSGFNRRGEESIPIYGWDNEFGTHESKVS
jgi:hypothetical protein